MGWSLRERWEIWDRLALRTDLALAERSTIDADRVDQMCAESAAQPARRSVSGASHPAAPLADLHAACRARSLARRARSLPA
jgi:hypothetical protein